MTRDRLQELRRISGVSVVADNDYCSIPVKAEISPVSNILGEYVDIRRGLENLSANNEKMKQSFQTADLRNIINNEMEEMRTKNLSIGQKLMIKFRELKNSLPEDGDFSLEARMKRTLFHGMYQEYLNIWKTHEYFLENYETKLKKNLKLHSKIMNCHQTDEEVEELLANRQTSLFVDNILEQTEKERRTLRDLLERYSELEKLERSIKEVHALFLRIQNLVLEQNDKIQIVEYHASQATVRVDKGTDKLDKARELKIKKLKCKTCLIIWVAVFFTIVIILAFVL